MSFNKQQKSELKERLLEHIDKRADCWVWAGSKCYSPKYPNNVYGVYTYHGKRYTVRRLMWELFKGSELGNYTITTSCHNSLCVNPDNPDHLVKTRNSRGTGRPKVRGSGCLSETALSVIFL